MKTDEEIYIQQYNHYLKSIGKDTIKMKQKIKDIAFRAVKTFAQAFVASIGVEATLSTIDWKTVISTAVLAMIISVMTNISSLE